MVHSFLEVLEPGLEIREGGMNQAKVITPASGFKDDEALVEQIVRFAVAL
jgi:hypothetical protein